MTWWLLGFAIVAAVYCIVLLGIAVTYCLASLWSYGRHGRRRRPSEEGSCHD